MKKKQARIASGKLIADACPNCGHHLDAVTVVSMSGPFDRVGPTKRISVKGQATMCAYCGAMLVFADEAGHLRTMTAAERSTYHKPELAKMLARELNIKPNFTRKSYN